MAFPLTAVLNIPEAVRSAGHATWVSYAIALVAIVLVAFDPDRLGPALRWEPSRGGALFPHLYRSLTLQDVVWDKSLPLGATGHIFPEGLW